VVRHLKILSAKGASRVTIDTTLLEKISRPAALLESGPKNEPALVGPFACQRRSAQAKKMLAIEESLLCRTRRVALVSRPAANETILVTGESCT
jgi:hypothetical protein